MLQERQSVTLTAMAFSLLTDLGQLHTLRCRLEGGVLWVQLHRPQAFNSLSAECLAELHRVLDSCQHPVSMLEALPSDAPRVIVLSGAGRAFCGGVDIKVMHRFGGRQMGEVLPASCWLLSCTCHHWPPLTCCLPLAANLYAHPHAGGGPGDWGQRLGLSRHALAAAAESPD